MKQFAFDPNLSAQQTFRFVTDDATPVFATLRWNTRSEFWYLDVAKVLPDGTQSAFTGVKVVPSFPLLASVKHLYTFPGDLILLPTTSNAGDSIGYNDLGSLWFLCWISDTEAAAWRTAHGVR